MSKIGKYELSEIIIGRCGGWWWGMIRLGRVSRDSQGRWGGSKSGVERDYIWRGVDVTSVND